VRNVDGIKIPHGLSRTQEETFVKRKKEGKEITSDILKPVDVRKNSEFGTEPIRDKIVNPKFSLKNFKTNSFSIINSS